LGSFFYSESGRKPGKVDTSLNEKLGKVEWGEYKLGDLFEINTYKKRFDANKVEILENGKFPYVVRTSLNNGIRGYIDEEEEFLNDGNTISFGQDTATMFYQEKPYFTGDKIKILKSKYNRFNKKNAQFFILTMTKSFSSFSWGSSSFSVKIIENQKISLPTKNSQIDFDFLESFMAEIERERIEKLESYLLATGLKDYTLTIEEEKVLADFESVKFEEFNVIDIFDVKNTKNILSRDILENSGKTPYLCASTENNAISSYITYDEKYLDRGNCVFIGGKTFVVTYQEKDFYSNDSHNLVLYLRNEEKNRLNQLYLATCINKSLGHKYSWGDSISNGKIQTDKVSLPVLNKQPNYAIMETFISAIQKLVIKDLVLYANEKRATTKK
jgi:Type I restriction modification DNA specificity domain